MASKDERYDGVLLGIAQQEGGIEQVSVHMDSITLPQWIQSRFPCLSFLALDMLSNVVYVFDPLEVVFFTQCPQSSLLLVSLCVYLIFDRFWRCSSDSFVARPTSSPAASAIKPARSAQTRVTVCTLRVVVWRFMLLLETSSTESFVSHNLPNPSSR